MLPYPLTLAISDGLTFTCGDASLPPEIHRQRTLAAMRSGSINVYEYDYHCITSHFYVRVDAREAGEIIDLPWKVGLKESSPVSDAGRAGGSVADVRVYRGRLLTWSADLNNDGATAPVEALRDLKQALIDLLDRYAYMGAERATDEQQRHARAVAAARQQG